MTRARRAGSCPGQRICHITHEGIVQAKRWSGGSFRDASISRQRVVDHAGAVDVHDFRRADG